MKTKKKEKDCFLAKEEDIFREIFLKKSNKDLLRAVIEASLNKRCRKIRQYNIEREEYMDWIENIGEDMLFQTDVGVVEIEINPSNDRYITGKNLALYSDTLYRVKKERKLTDNYQFVQLSFTWSLDLNGRDVSEYAWQTTSGIYLYENTFIREFNLDKIVKYWYEKNEEKIEEYKYIIMLGLDLDELDKLYAYTKDKLIKKYRKELEKANENQELMKKISAKEKKCEV